MRLFIALDIDEAVRERIARFVEGVSGFAADARWMRPESLHVTLKFIGEQPEPVVDQIKQALSNVSASAAEIRFRGYGFFPTARSARVFWVGIEAGPQLATLAAAIDDKTAALGIPKEDRAFSPHLTLARGAGGSGSARRHNKQSIRKRRQPILYVARAMEATVDKCSRPGSAGRSRITQASPAERFRVWLA